MVGRPLLVTLTLVAALLAGCTGGGETTEDVQDPADADDPSPDAGMRWVSAAFDDGRPRAPLYLNGTIAAGEASGCSISFDGQEVCVGEEARLDLAPHVAHGFAYAFNATLAYSPADTLGATNVDFEHSEPWGGSESEGSSDEEVVTGAFVRLTEDPLFLSVYHLLPAEHDITFSLRVDLEILQGSVSPSLPLALTADATVAEVAVPLADDGVVRAWDGADAFLGRFEADASVPGPSGDEVPVARINLSAADRSRPLVLQVIGPAPAVPAVLVHQSHDAPAPTLRFLASQATHVPQASMAGPVAEQWQFTPDPVPLRVGVYMGRPEGYGPWSADGLHMVLNGPDGAVLAEVESGCTFCGGGTVAAWSPWHGEGAGPGTYTAAADAYGPYPEAVGAGGEVGHILVAYQR